MRLEAIAWVQTMSGKVKVMINVTSNTGNFIKHLFLNLISPSFKLIILFIDICYDGDMVIYTMHVVVYTSQSFSCLLAIPLQERLGHPPDL